MRGVDLNPLLVPGHMADARQDGGLLIPQDTTLSFLLSSDDVGSLPASPAPLTLDGAWPSRKAW